MAALIIQYNRFTLQSSLKCFRPQHLYKRFLQTVRRGPQHHTVRTVCITFIPFRRCVFLIAFAAVFFNCISTTNSLTRCNNTGCPAETPAQQKQLLWLQRFTDKIQNRFQLRNLIGKHGTPAEIKTNHRANGFSDFIRQLRSPSAAFHRSAETMCYHQNVTPFCLHFTQIDYAAQFTKRPRDGKILSHIASKHPLIALINELFK